MERTGSDGCCFTRRHYSLVFARALLPQILIVLVLSSLTVGCGTTGKSLVEAPGTAPEAAPENDLQKQIADLWQETLGVEAVGLDDNFFDLGGHSLLAVRVHRELKERVDRPLSITDMFRLPTVRALAAFLAGETDEGAVAKQGEDRAAARRDARARRSSRRRGRDT